MGGINLAANTQRVKVVARGIPFDELMTAIDIIENTLLRGRYSEAKFNRGEVFFKVGEHFIRTIPLVNGKKVKIIGPSIIKRHKIKWKSAKVDFEYRYLDTRIKEFITLKVPCELSFKIQLSTGDRLKKNFDGSISLLSRTGTKIVTLEKIVGVDAKGKLFDFKYQINGDLLKITAENLSDAVYPITLDPAYTVATASTANYRQRNLARKSNGDLWCCYQRSYQIYCAYSTDEGETWTEEQITSADYQFEPSIAIDSADNIHLVWRGTGWGTNTANYNVQYRKRTSTGWGTVEHVTDVAYDQYRPMIAIDSSDNVHVVWRGKGWGTNTTIINLQYRKRTSTGWQTQEAITDIATDQDDPNIAIDSNDNVHVVWGSRGWGTYTDYYNIQYRERTSTGWQTQEHVTDIDYYNQNPSIAIDSSDNIHIVWQAAIDSSNYNIKYCKRTASGWGTVESVTSVSQADTGQEYPSIALDSSDNVHVVWEGKGWGTNTAYYNLQYRERTSEGWQTQVGLTDTAHNNSAANLIWALHPTVSGYKTNRPKTGYAFVWYDGTYMKFYKSDDLTWEGPLTKTLTQTISVNTSPATVNQFQRINAQPVSVSSILSKTLPPMSLTQTIGVLDSLQPKAIEKLSEQPITVLSTLTKIGVFERIFSQPIKVVQSFTSELSTVSVITRHTTEVSLSAGRVDTRTYRRAYIEWDISEIPSGVTITAVKLKYHGKANGLDKCSIYSMEKQPSAQPDTDTGNKAIYDDITDGKCYVSASETFPVVGSDQEIDLGSDAVADLQAAINAGRSWFAIGIKTSEETIGEFDEIYSEDYEDADPKPTLSVTYTTLSAPTYAGIYAARMDKTKDNYLRQNLVAKVPTDLVESISFYAKADSTPAQIEVLVHYDDYFSDTTTINLSTEYTHYFAKFSPGKNIDYMKITYVGDTEAGKYLYFDKFVIDFHELEVKGSIDSYIQPFQEIDTSITRDSSGNITKIVMSNATRTVTLTITRDAAGRITGISRKVT